MDNDYVVAADGIYDIYFRPNYDGGEDWHSGCIYAAKQADVEPTTVDEPTEPVVEPTTTEPVETITVKFTDALNWGAANVYYWDNGAEWPGTAMEKAEVNDYGQQVYTAEVPADVKGIIFNGNGNQTVDITEGIADGAQWYTTGEKEGDNYKVNLVSDVVPTEPDVEPTEPIVEPTTVVEPTSEPAQGAYYLVGSFNEWAADEAYKLTKNDAADTDEYTINVELSKDDSFKVIYTDGDNTTWYPDGMDNDYVVAADGTYDVYFRPNYDGGEDWHSGCIYAAKQADEEPTTVVEPATVVVPTEPVVEPTTSEPSNTITVKFTDALNWGSVNVYYWDNGGDWPGSAMEKAEVNEFGQQVYTAEIPTDVKGIIFNGNGKQTVDITEGIADGAQWYTSGEMQGSNYKVVLVG